MFAFLNADRLQVRLECPAGNPGGLAAVAAEVFGLAAFDLLVAERGSLFTNVTYGAHGTSVLMADTVRVSRNDRSVDTTTPFPALRNRAV